jgi:hypothetical protein
VATSGLLLVRSSEADDADCDVPTLQLLVPTRVGFCTWCNFSADAGDAIHCFDLVYPQAAKRAFDCVDAHQPVAAPPRELANKTQVPSVELATRVLWTVKKAKPTVKRSNLTAKKSSNARCRAVE